MDLAHDRGIVNPTRPVRILEPELDRAELEALRRSAQVLREATASPGPIS